MAGAQPAPALTPAVIWSAVAVRKMRAAAVEGLMALPRRGMEVGGLLLGSVNERAPYLFSIEDICPVPCEHRFGPGFSLSEADHARLREQLASVRAFGEHCVVGFFRSRTGPGGRAEFDQADRELLDNYFDDPAHIFLAIHPRSYHRCDARIYFRSGSRLSTTDRVCELRELEPASAAGAREPGSESAAPAEAPASGSRTVAEPQTPEPPAEFLLEIAPRSRRMPAGAWVAGLFCGVALAGFLAVHFRATSATPPQPDPPPPAAAVPLPAVASSPSSVSAEPENSAQPERLARRALSLENIQPAIPESIRARMTEPVSVTLRVDIDETGRAVAVRPAEYTGGIQRYLAQRAADAARSARFRPAESVSGRPLASTETITVVVEPK